MINKNFDIYKTKQKYNMKKIDEGQTQVYMNGGIEPQHGVNSSPYLQHPPQQLLDIIKGLKTGTNKTPAQLLAILVGMGIQQKMAETAILMSEPSVTMQENQKNHNKMNFTLSSLYEQVNLCINQLKEIKSDRSRVSYTTQSALSILESTLNSFPMRFNNDVTAVVSEEVENTVNPSLKFEIASKLHKQLSVASLVNPVQQLREFIENIYNENKFLFRVSQSVQNTSQQRGKMYESLTESLTNILKENNEIAKQKFQIIAAKNPWSTDCKVIQNELKIEESRLVDSSIAKIVKTYSPINKSSNGLSFSLHGKTYSVKDGEIKESVVNDTRFYNVLEGLKHFKLDGDNIITFGENGKILEYNITEGKLTYGKSDLTNASIIELKEALTATNFSGYRNMWKNDTICRFFESIDYLYEMDNFTTLQSQEFLGLYLTVIAIGENIFINKVNPSMQLNEMIKVETATDAVKIAKDFMNYDISSIFNDKLVAEKSQKAIQEKLTSNINDKLTFLEEKKAEIKNAIDQYGKTTELSEALSILEQEIVSNETKLANSYLTEGNAKKKYAKLLMDLSGEMLSKSEFKEYVSDYYNSPDEFDIDTDSDYYKAIELANDGTISYKDYEKQF